MKRFENPPVPAYWLKLLALFVVVTIAAGSRANAQVNVFIDYTNFQTRLNSATASAGVANFNATEVQTIQTNIMNYLNTAFNGYQINFTTTNPGGTFETLHFGLTGSGFGLADRIDLRNLVGNDVARVFTANFGTFINPAAPRATQIVSLSNSLGGTASHEVGHNIGLEHRDPYGIAGIGNANSNGGHQTFGQQNNHIMATGITGLTNAQRIVPRTFSDLSHAKLQFANGVVADPIAPISEQAAPHSTAATAQNLTFSNFTDSPSAYTAGFLLEGSLSANGQADFYSFNLLEGTYTTMQIVSTVINGSNAINSILTLFDSNGTTILASNTSTQVSANGVNIGGSTYSNDASIYNFLAPRDDIYFLRVTATTASDLGAYSLFVATTAIPEPSGSLIAVFFIVVLSFRRQKTVV
ncbi:MAG TPA: hypothetical protein PKD64_14675 [Pirellulaceae bacterium]|mgnify:CR=1 FL=1|nr:hypothetical protein [Pirellulaceae bacterium]HMO93426.1 hypothetical protein [Pirellulaceae bacterium]HMP71403.1 hypothetical protein [Pirellulaceae bacterium]